MNWINNTDKEPKPDAMLTITVFAFAFFALVIVAVIVLAVAGKLTPEQISAISDLCQAVGIPALFGSSLTYGFRRYTGARYGQGTYVPPEEQ